MSNTIDENLLVTSKFYARSVYQSLTPEQKGKCINAWGADEVNSWLNYTPEDSTRYVIDESDKETAYNNGKQKAQEKTGHDGKANWWRSSVDALGSVASIGVRFGANAIKKGIQNSAGIALSNAVSKHIEYNAANQATKEATKKAAEDASKEASKKAATANNKLVKNLSDIATVVTIAAFALWYRLNKPNKEEYDAIMQLHGEGNLLGETQSSLETTQGDMQDATQEVVEKAEGAEAKKDDAQEHIEEDKVLLDFYKAQYEGVKAKAIAAKKGGPRLTSDEKSLLETLAPYMENLSSDITKTNETVSGEVQDIRKDIEKAQDRYDDGAATLEESIAITDFAGGLDTPTAIMCGVEAASQTLNTVSAGIATGKLVAKNGLALGTLTPFIVIGAADVISCGLAAKEQLEWMFRIIDEIGVRHDTEDLEDVTQKVCDEERENFNANIDMLDEMTIELPEDINVPEKYIPSGNENGNNGGALFALNNNQADETKNNSATPLFINQADDKNPKKELD